MEDEMWKTILEIKTCLQSENLQDCILKYRKSSLVVAGLLGLGLAILIYYLTGYLKPKNQILQSSLTILALGLPTFFILWLFRTHDVQRQIDKTQGQIDIPQEQVHKAQEQIDITQEQVHKAQEQIDITQEGINNSSFLECARMLTTDVSSSTQTAKHQYVVALEQLAYLRNKTEFDKERIDYLTQNINLRGQNLTGARLNNLDLSKANLHDTILNDAVYNLATKFPKDFYAEEKGMIYEQDIEF